jgi:hypothetical protein
MVQLVTPTEQTPAGKPTPQSLKDDADLFGKRLAGFMLAHEQ